MNKDSTSKTTTAAPWYGISWDVAGRIGLLFGTLCLVKLVMLAGFRKHLFEIHWRTGPAGATWANLAAFGIFVLLAGLNLWRFARKCSAGGARVVRAANICILVLGAAFIFLTFHIGDKNYLYPVLQHLLGWWDLKAYLSLAFFFQPPFLAAWLFVYALIYYGLVRTGREHLVLYMTAILAVLYLAIFLNQLMIFKSALVVVDCLGMICLLTGSTVQRPLNWFSWAQPWLWLGFFYLILQLENQDRSLGDPEFVILTGGAFILFGGLSVVAWHRKFYPAWSWLLPFSFAAFLLLTNINYPLAANFRNLLCLGLTLPRYFLGEFFLAFSLLCLAKLYRHWLPKASLLWLDGISITLIILALLDLRLSQLMAVRLDWQVIQFGASAKMMWREARPFLPEMAVGLTLLVALYAIFIGLWQRGPTTKNLVAGTNGKFLLLTFLVLGVAGYGLATPDKAENESAWLLITTSPLAQWTDNSVMDRKTFIDTASRLGMAQMLARPSAAPTRPSRPLNVVLIFQESSYNKYLSLFNGQVDTQPLLAKYKERMELFPNFFSSFAGSINARFATLCGLYPVRDYKAFTLNRVPVKSFFDILHAAGYRCSVFDSEYIDYSGFRDFLQNRGIEAMYDADTMPGRQTAGLVSWGLREGETTRAIRSQIAQYATNATPFFLSYFPVAPHNPFDGVPEEFHKFNLKKLGDYTPVYLNELLYLDACIASILDQLKTSGVLDQTLVVITDDHGEMLGENGGPIGHGWAVTPELANIPLIIMDPAAPGYRVNPTVGSQVDLLPTVLDLLGLPLPADQLYQGSSLYSTNAQTARTIYLNSFLQYAVLTGSRYTGGSRETQGAAAAGNFSTKACTITNAGARTFFPELPSPNVSSPSIALFDTFQENLLKNYALYCQMIRN